MAIRIDSCVLSTCHIFLSAFLLFGTKIFQVHLVFSLVEPQNQQFPREPLFLLLWNVSINQTLGIRCAHCSLGVIALIPVSEQLENIQMCIHICIYLFVYIKNYQFIHIILSIPIQFHRILAETVKCLRFYPTRKLTS